MFEISLVPEVKAKLLHQEKIRNLVIVVCIFVGIGCAVLIAALIGTSTALKLKSSSLDTEIACRIDTDSSAAKKCSNTGIAIMQTANLNDMLSIQNELNTVGLLNAKKTKPSRLLPSTESLLAEPNDSPQVFSMLEIALPSDAEYNFQTSEMRIDFENTQMAYDVVAHALTKKSQHTAYLNFKESINNSYFDYGDYKYKDENGNITDIPTYCIVEEKIVEGQVYGVYNRYAPGCEAPMSTSKKKNDGKDEEEYLQKEVSKIYIRRTYSSNDDYTEYVNGNGRSKKGENVSFNEAPKGFYFESACVSYGEDGKYSETATKNNCPILTEKFETTTKEENYNDETGQRVVRFDVALSFSEKIFSQSSHNVLFYYPSKKTVSTSYRAIEDFFTSPIDKEGK